LSQNSFHALIDQGDLALLGRRYKLAKENNDASETLGLAE